MSTCVDVFVILMNKIIIIIIFYTLGSIDPEG